LFFLLFLIFSCSWIGSQEAKPTTKVEFVETGQIINPQKLKEGGSLFIVPFKAGINVESNPELDKIALMIVSGISEILRDQNQNIELLDAGNAHNARFIMTGYVTELKKPSKMKKWVLRSKNITLSVKGKMVDNNSGDTVLIFTDNNNSSKAGLDHKKLGLAIGQDIGRFVTYGAKIP